VHSNRPTEARSVRHEIQHANKAGAVALNVTVDLEKREGLRKVLLRVVGAQRARSASTLLGGC